MVFLLLPRFFTHWGSYLVAAEAFALVAEVPVLLWLLRPEPRLRALSAWALANSASYAVGMLVYWLR